MQNEVVSQTGQSEQIEQTTCCIVGGGPAGAVLALLLARKGIAVLLLEEHMDFDRDFRGDTVHPSTMQIMDQLGLADSILQLEHSIFSEMTVEADGEPITLANFRHLKTRFPYVVMLPQVHFLDFITSEAKRYANFQLVMGARVEKLIEENGAVRGVHYRGQDGWHEVQALLTVAADGRFSRVRRLAGFEPIKTAPPMDVLWFRLPRKEGDPEQSAGRLGGGHVIIKLKRTDDWQMGYIIPKGGYQQIKAAGLEKLQQEIVELEPEMADRIEALQEWKQVSVLSVESSRVPRWYRPGLLLIGDAAHVMSPVGGVGINCAVQDAVVAANVLIGPLKAGKVQIKDLAAVQKQREWPIKVVQGFQSFLQKQVLATVLQSDKPFKIPGLARFLLHVPILRDLPARFIAFGPRTVRVKHP